MGDFDSIKIGVCDCYWTPPMSEDEVFLGLTKGGCELSYIPEWYDLKTDRYGHTADDAVLSGESLSVRIPLAETDMGKLEMFAHTATKFLDRLAFGSSPGLRLKSKAGRLRLHPIAMGSSNLEDVVVYKAVNKAPLNLNYKLDEERIFQTEFIGLLDRTNVTGAMLFAIGNSDSSDTEFKLSDNLLESGIPSNLRKLVELSGGSIWVSPPEVELEPMEDIGLRTIQFKAFTELNGVIYDVTQEVNFSLAGQNGVTAFGFPVITGGLPTSSPVDYEGNSANAYMWASENDGGVSGKFVLKMWSIISELLPCMLKDGPESVYYENAIAWRKVVPGDRVNIRVDVSWGDMTATANIIERMVGASSVGYLVRVIGNIVDLVSARSVFGNNPLYVDVTGFSESQMMEFFIGVGDVVVGGPAVIPDSVIGGATRLYGPTAEDTLLAIQTYYSNNPGMFD